MVFNGFLFLFAASFLAGYYIPLSFSSQILLLAFPVSALLLASRGVLRSAAALFCAAFLIAGLSFSGSRLKDGERASGGGVWRFSVETTTTTGAMLASGLTGSVWTSHRGLAGQVSRGDSVIVLGHIRDGFLDTFAFHAVESTSVFDTIRRRLDERMTSSISSRWTSALASALLTGERGHLPPSVRQTFRNAGASHLLALSGLHVGLVGAASLLLLRRLAGKGWASTAGVILVSGMYALVSGARPSTLRAWLMLAPVLLMWQYSGRVPDLLFVWSITVILLGFASGWDLLSDMGAVMSFGAVLSLVLLGRSFRGRGGFVLSAAYAGLVVTIALAPLVSAVYGGFNPASPLATLLSLPFMLAIMGTAFMTLLLPWLQAPSVLAEWTAYIWLRILTSVGCGSVEFRGWMWIAWGVSILFLWFLSRRGRFRRRFR